MLLLTLKAKLASFGTFLRANATKILLGLGALVLAGAGFWYFKLRNKSEECSDSDFEADYADLVDLENLENLKVVSF